MNKCLYCDKQCEEDYCSRECENKDLHELGYDDELEPCENE